MFYDFYFFPALFSPMSLNNEIVNDKLVIAHFIDNLKFTLFLLLKSRAIA